MTQKDEKNGRPRRARPPRLTAAAPTRHICHPKNEKQKGNYPLVALHHRFLRKTEAMIESKFMICNQAGAARGTRAGGVCGMLCGAPLRARKCVCGGQLGLQGWCRAVWMGCMGAWLAYAAHAGVPHAVLGTRGGGRPWAVGTTHLPGSGGRALADDWSKLLPWWPRRIRPIHAERAARPGRVSNGSKFISSKSAPHKRLEPAKRAECW